MPLIDLKTNLKDLKYGHDQRDGNSSNQPFVPTLIPANEDSLANNYLPQGIFPSLDISSFTKIDISQDTLKDSALLLAAGTIGGAVVGKALGKTSTGLLIGSAIGGATALGNIIANGDIEQTIPRISLSQFEPVPAISGTGGNDFLVRGGLLLPTIMLKDASRISRFLTSQNGLFFTLKQNYLSRISVRPEYAGLGIGKILNDDVYNPISSVLGAVGAPFGLHPNKQ